MILGSSLSICQILVAMITRPDIKKNILLPYLKVGENSWYCIGPHTVLVWK